MHLSFDPAITLEIYILRIQILEYYPENVLQKYDEMYKQGTITALFVITKDWQQPESTRKQLNKQLQLHNEIQYSGRGKATMQ